MPNPTDFWLHDTVSALAYSIAQAHIAEAHPEFNPPYNDLTRFVLEQQARLPDFLRGPMRIATLGFDLLGCLHSGWLFHGRPARVRERQVAAWKDSPVGFQRDLIRYHESLASLALYSRSRSNAANLLGQESAQVISEPTSVLNCDVAVVGSGPGGAITACLLAEAGRDVLLLEEGAFQPLESCPPFSIDEMVQKYRNGGQTVALGKNKIAYVEGRCVGGGSEINSGLYHRTPPEILESWRRDFDVCALTEEELRPHFEACEKELSVSLLEGSAPPASLKLAAGAQALGWKCLEIPRWFRNEASGGGSRQSMTRTFVPRFLRAGGRLLPRARVQRLGREGPAWSLEAQFAGTRILQIKAQTLFLSGGAVQTPAILRRSGIAQNIGNSLQMHPTIKLVARFSESVNSADMGVPVHQVKEFAPRISFGCSISTPAYLALGLLDYSRDIRKITEDWSRMANYYAMIVGDGRGSVRVLPGFRDPLVRYQITEGDRRSLAEGLRKLSELLFEAGAVNIWPAMSKAEPLLTRDELSKLPNVLPNGLANLMTIHLFSSCPMGENKSRCAVDSFGRVHGFKDLFVADASLLCSAPGVNPQGSVMGLVRRNVSHFLKNCR